MPQETINKSTLTHFIELINVELTKRNAADYVELSFEGNKCFLQRCTRGRSSRFVDKTYILKGESIKSMLYYLTGFLHSFGYIN